MAFSLGNGLFLLAFLLSAAVQFNDPDALPWIAVYLLAAAMCLNQWFGSRLAWLPPLLFAGSLGGILWLLPNIVGQVSLVEIVESVSMRTRAVEEAREIGGLGLITLWAGIVMLHHRGRQLDEDS